MTKCTINPLVDALLGIGMSMDEALETFDRWKDTDEFFFTEEQVDTSDAEVLDNYPLIYKVPYNGQHLSVEGEHVPQETFVFRDRAYGFVTGVKREIVFKHYRGYEVTAVQVGDDLFFESVSPSTRERLKFETYAEAHGNARIKDEIGNLLSMYGNYQDKKTGLYFQIHPVFIVNEFFFTVVYKNNINDENFIKPKEWDENPFNMIDKIINQHS